MADKREFRKVFQRVGKYIWELPATARPDMRVPARLLGDKEMFEAAFRDRTVEQLINTTTLPGIVEYALAMPDFHQGYGFPIGGVAAMRTDEGVISPGGVGYDINCLAGDSRVLHEYGYTCPIAEMVHGWDGARLRCQNFEAQQEDSTGILLYLNHNNPTAPVQRMVTETGEEIIATADHPFWTPTGMVNLGDLRPGDRVAVYPFQGVPYEEPTHEAVSSDEELNAVLARLGAGSAGKARGQILAHLRRRELWPLRYDSPALPPLLKLLGYVLGKGTLRFADGKGTVWFYGRPEDLEAIRADVTAIGFTPARVYTRRRQHRVQTTCDEYESEHPAYSFKVTSTTFAVLLAALGSPIGAKASQDFRLPEWLMSAPRWQQRLFLAAFFGAELSFPQTVTGHGANFYAPVLSVNKQEGYVESGQAFLSDIACMLAGFDVEAKTISERQEQVNADGTCSIRLCLSISSTVENLLRLWSRINFEYNRRWRQTALVAVQYLKVKERIVFPAFDAYRAEATDGLGESGMVWTRIATLEPLEGFEEPVYDFTVAHPAHNFIANTFVVSNCGVRLLGTHLEHEEIAPHLTDLASVLYQTCPSGVGGKGRERVSNRELENLITQGARWALKRGLARPEDLAHTEEGGCLPGADPAYVSARAKERGRPQVGSLGAGNHFLEIDVVEDVYDPDTAAAFRLWPGQIVVQIHCGSRGFGHQVCDDYVKSLQTAVHKYGLTLPDRELVCAPISSPEGRAYYAAMACAVNYAFVNRQVLAMGVREAFERVLAGKVADFDLYQVYDVAHNIAKFEEHEVGGQRMRVCVHRKGATRAFGPHHPGVPADYRAVGQPVLVPGSMGTESYVLVGTQKAMELTFGSTCHGAGRVMSRRKAIKTVHGGQLKRELSQKGIVVRAGSNKGLAEEAPVAYKDVSQVVEVVHGLGIARKVARLRPLAVIKG